MATHSVTLSDEDEERLDRAVARAAVVQPQITSDEWLDAAIVWALDEDQKPHMPDAVKRAFPRLVGGTLDMPHGRTWDAR